MANSTDIFQLHNTKFSGQVKKTVNARDLHKKLEVKTNYTTYLLLFTLLIIFGGIWFGYYLAHSIVEPIEILVDGTNRISKGPLHPRGGAHRCCVARRTSDDPLFGAGMGKRSQGRERITAFAATCRDDESDGATEYSERCRRLSQSLPTSF